MQIQSHLYNKVLYIMLKGELDEYHADYARNTLDDMLDESEFREVILDLNELSFMDSTGIGVFIGRYKKCKAKHIPIFICNPSMHAEQIFNMTGLYEIMPKIN